MTNENKQAAAKLAADFIYNNGLDQFNPVHHETSLAISYYYIDQKAARKRYGNALFDAVDIQPDDMNISKRLIEDIHHVFLQKPNGFVNMVVNALKDIKKAIANDEILASQSKIKELEASLQKDHLSDLNNRSFFDKQIRHIANTEQEYSLVMIDADHFKKINDNHGHLGGDEAIKHIAKILKKATRPTDFVCRYGGEEFAIILPGTNMESSKIVANRIQSFLNETPMCYDGKSIQITASIGISQGSKLINDTIERADLAVYAVKEAGRNGVMHYNEDSVDDLDDTSDIDQIQSMNH